MRAIAFIGLGNMGSGMCTNLIKAGYQVCVYDLSADAVSKAVELGARAADTIADAVTGAECIVTMLPAGPHVLEVYFGADGVAMHADDDAVFVDCSTIAVDHARDAAAQADAHGYAMIDAPVSGGVAAAAAGTLTFMVGGAAEAVQRARPVLNAMGKTIVHAGPSGNGQVAKIANNMLLGISMIATSEAFVLAEKLGLDAQTFFDISSNASGQNWSMTSYCPAPGPVPAAPSNNSYQPGFAVDMMLKDLRLASAAAKHAEADTALGDMALQTYEALSKAGHGAMDFSVIIKKLVGDLPPA